jgi:hypothetical protein
MRASASSDGRAQGYQIAADLGAQADQHHRLPRPRLVTQPYRDYHGVYRFDTTVRAAPCPISTCPR